MNIDSKQIHLKVLLILLPWAAKWRLFYLAAAAAAASLQSCPTLCDPRDSSPPGFPVPGNYFVRLFPLHDNHYS